MTEITYTLEDLRGVGRVELALRPDQRAYVFFGSNGVGKTKCLEGLFQYYYFPHFDGVITKIRDLSTGFASLLKILQTIISGYGFFTNSTDLANVKGIVFIDEIESHLHVEWQSKIIPLLKRLFSNTTFFVATHSPIVLSQLKEGEAYRLEKQADGVVRATIIEASGVISCESPCWCKNAL
ncbi:MAG: hypothetical protein RIR79_1714 [Pseudomonadota bacterium]|jgi:predicted ATP-binding protein involved in virulence